MPVETKAELEHNHQTLQEELKNEAAQQRPEAAEDLAVDTSSTLKPSQIGTQKKDQPQGVESATKEAKENMLQQLKKEAESQRGPGQEDQNGNLKPSELEDNKKPTDKADGRDVTTAGAQDVITSLFLVNYK